MITSIFTHFRLLFLVHLFSNEFISLQASEFVSYSTNFTTCWEIERNALLKFKEGLKDPSGRLSSWVGNYCCTWSGVGCNRQTGHVTKLNLIRVPTNFAPLQGTISPSLLDLKYLDYLNLSWNNFEQTPIPNFIGSFTKLEYLDLSFASFSGLVPPHLGNLSNLRYLDLYSNQGIFVSDLNWIFGLSSLEVLSLNMANLSFASTNWLQAINMLPSLMLLSLSSCTLHDIPTTLPIVNFSSIQYIELSSNHFNSPLPGWLFNISSLVVLDLSFNSFSGQIPPYVENLHNMTDLNLDFNDLSGPLPISIGNLSSLELLYLSSNQLNGTIPQTIGQLKKLICLDISSNNWGGVMSRIHFLHLNNMQQFLLSSVEEKSLVFDVGYDWIPPFNLNLISIRNCQMNPKFPIWLQNQKELMILDLTNVGISGYVPDWFWKLSSQILLLSLRSNKLCGKLPRALKFRLGSTIDLSFNLFEGPVPLFSGLFMLSLRNNSFSGPIPANFAHANPDLGFMDLSMNYINGSIPSSINKLESLVILLLANNELSGKIPSMNRLNKLRLLDSANNNLFGNIPSSLCSKSLGYLKLNGNNLYGKLSSLRNCTKLVTLGLANNQFHGGIPRWIGETVSRLSVLQLRGNMLRGKIPKSLCSLPFLHVMDLGWNNFSGSIPPCLGNLSSLYHSKNDILTSEAAALAAGFAAGTVDAANELGDDTAIAMVDINMPFYFGIRGMELNVKGQTLEFVNIINLVNLIDLSGNNLEGEIPEEIMKLSALGTLNLSQNQLTGNIPEKIGDLQLLETLDLSVNHLSGPIPASTSSMTLLSHLNLSYNDLYGPIPLANQFQTFNDPSIYEGNPKLCGAPLLTNCSTHKNDTPEGYTGKDRDESWSERLWFYIGIASGFVVGFWTVCGTLVIKRSWRHAYFRFVEEMKDKINVFIVVKVARLQKKLKGSERS